MKIVKAAKTTQNPRIHAAGDVCLDWKFTHAADFSARIVIQNALFLGRKKASALTMPWCTYTDPEIAHVGLYEPDARERGSKSTPTCASSRKWTALFWTVSKRFREIPCQERAR